MGALIWPMAEAEAAKYKAVMDTINAEQSSIDKAANDSNHNKARLVDGQGNLSKEYYDAFEGKAQEWSLSAKAAATSYTTFKTLMADVYLKAQEQYSMWAGRIGQRYPDPPQDDA